MLGGGRIDNDGLYKHKKSMFPKDHDSVYFTGRKIILKDVHDKLIKNVLNEIVVEFDDANKNYFPKYRI